MNSALINSALIVVFGVLVTYVFATFGKGLKDHMLSCAERYGRIDQTFQILRAEAREDVRELKEFFAKLTNEGAAERSNAEERWQRSLDNLRRELLGRIERLERATTLPERQ